MKFQPDKLEFSITGYGDGWIAINGQKIYTSTVLHAGKNHYENWNVASFDQLTPAHFELLLPNQPELIIFGSGNRLKFAAPSIIAPLIKAGIGIETMDTPAACRTYNILASEGRRASLALLIESSSS